MCPAQIAPEWGRVGAADLAGASSAAWAVWHAFSKKRRFFIPAEGFFGKIFAFGDQFRRLAARLFDSEALRRSQLDANEIYEDLAIGRPLPFLRVGQVDAFADASVSFADIQLRLDAHKHQLRW